MSRVGKMPVQIPAGVKLTVGNNVVVSGPKGQLERVLVEGITIEQAGGAAHLHRSSEERNIRANHGLMRALLNNMVVGVTKGFERRLEIIGVGYKAEMKGPKLVLSLGYSHPIEFSPPTGISISVDTKANKIVVSGADKEAVGQVASDIRGYRSPDSYKGKGVRYEGERVRLKAGKSAKK